MTEPEPVDVAELRRRLAAGTPGPWHYGKHDGDPTAFLAGCAAYSDAPIVWCVTDGNAPENDVYTLPAVTGNGPTSEANAILIAAAINALPGLLDRLDAAEERVAALEDVLAALVMGAEQQSQSHADVAALCREALGNQAVAGLTLFGLMEWTSTLIAAGDRMSAWIDNDDDLAPWDDLVAVWTRAKAGVNG